MRVDSKNNVQQKTKIKKKFHFKINYICRKLINRMSYEGKKSVCERLLSKTLIHLSKESKSPLNYLLKAVTNVLPMVEVKNLRQGNRNTKLVLPLSEKRALNIALTQIIKEARSKKASFDKNLAEVLTECSQSRGQLIKNKESVEEEAIKSRGLSHYRW
jgi:small subunit ribosomal protein S7